MFFFLLLLQRSFSIFLKRISDQQSSKNMIKIFTLLTQNTSSLMCDFKWTSPIVYGHYSGSMRLYINAQLLIFSVYNVYNCHYPIWVASSLSFGRLCQRPAWTSHMHYCTYWTHQYTIQIGCYTHDNHDSSLCWHAKLSQYTENTWGWCECLSFLQVFGYKLRSMQTNLKVGHHKRFYNSSWVGHECTNTT